jgi:uncharacterized protein
LKLHRDTQRIHRDPQNKKSKTINQKIMINLIPLEDCYSIYQLDFDQEIPSQIFDSGFYSITKTGEEVSIVTNYRIDVKNLKADHDWKGFKVAGILDFSLIGILNDITKPLKDNNISVFVISTFNTDYIFVKKEWFDRSIEIFKSSENICIKDN